MRILLVEDEEKLNQTLCYQLKAEGYQVDGCLDGEEALYYVRECAYDVIILDWMLPGIDGITVLRQIRKQGINTPVMMLTALGTLQNKLEGLTQGADDYLVKPFAIEELTARIQCLHRRPRQLQSAHMLSFLYRNREMDYYACVGSIYRGNSYDYYDSSDNILEVCVLKSLAPLQSQIQKQRLSFLCLILLSSAVLFLFSYFFTKKLLKPVAEKQQQQTQFVSAASHELRAPLAVMLSAASACKKASSEEQASFFKIIEEEGEGISRLISDLLTLAEADEHRFSMHPAFCEPDTLLLNVYEAYETRASKLGFSLKIQLPDTSLPTVYWDPERIRQILAIFLENAFAYTPKGSKITLSVQLKDKYIQLSVMDNGPGIPREKKEMIFDRFYRSDPARSKNGHFGLGLSIAKELVSAHKGTIYITDTPGSGATFTVTLPIAPFSVKNHDWKAVANAQIRRLL